MRRAIACITNMAWEQYSDDIMSAMASQITGVPSFAELYSTVAFVLVHIKEAIKASRHWPMRWESTVTGGFPSQRASNAEMFPFDDVIMKSIIVIGTYIYIYWDTFQASYTDSDQWHSMWTTIQLIWNSMKMPLHITSKRCRLRVIMTSSCCASWNDAGRRKSTEMNITDILQST